jgi:hypothetical protein
MSKKLIIPGIAALVLVGILGGFRIAGALNKDQPYVEDGIQFISRVVGKEFQVYKDGEWKTEFLKGVNIGAGKPGYFPGELAITKEEYLRWFRYIRDMDADVIRVYTTLKPAFYDALYEFNLKSEEPLYLMQGVWVKEEDMAELMDGYADGGRIREDFIKDAKDLVDIFHGNATLPEKRGFASGKYTKDVSKYVVGWIMGIEWDPYFVKETDEKNEEKHSYAGEYLYTENATPFETFLSEVGDQVLSYEMDRYRMTRALSFTNWLTTDLLEHPNEPYEGEDMVSVNVERIMPKETFKSGVFAAYHVYPYYPDFLSYEKDYLDYRDEAGKVNTYRAYLEDLIKAHSIPVMVAEFGIPASRGKAHDSEPSGYNQGNHTEKEQGEIIASLLRDIHGEGYSGAMVFAWQDEWFKKTWNTMELDFADRRPYWSNPQSNEQEFGLLAFEPGEKESVVYVDGDSSEWKKQESFLTEEGTDLYVRSDEKYVYFLVESETFDFEKDTIYIPIDTLSGQGSLRNASTGSVFAKPSEFIIQIDGVDNSRILVDSYYDSFYYLYGEKAGLIEKNALYSYKGNGTFNPMSLCLSRGLYLPVDDRTLPFTSYETGKLKLGDGNPKSAGYDSLADFAVKDGTVEIRIPWQLLNVMDPSTKTIMGDLHSGQGVSPVTADGFHIGIGISKAGTVVRETIPMMRYDWEVWDLPTYHERLKESYGIVKSAFESLE